MMSRILATEPELAFGGREPGSQQSWMALR